MHSIKETHLNTVAIISNLEQLETTLLDQDLERGGAGIDRIFDQFLQSMYRCHNDLACCDLVHDIGI
jgi:hypothetical protein